MAAGAALMKDRGDVLVIGGNRARLRRRRLSREDGRYERGQRADSDCDPDATWPGHTAYSPPATGARHLLKRRARLACERIRAELEMGYLTGGPFSALGMPDRAGPVHGPQPSAFPARARVVDAAVQAAREEPRADTAPAASPLSASSGPGHRAHRTWYRSTSPRSRPARRCCTGPRSCSVALSLRARPLRRR